MNSFIVVVLTRYTDYRNCIDSFSKWHWPSEIWILSQKKKVKFHVSSTAPLELKFLPVCNGMKCYMLDRIMYLWGALCCCYIMQKDCFLNLSFYFVPDMYYLYIHIYIYIVMCYTFLGSIYKYCRDNCAYVTGYAVLLSILFKAWKCLSIFLYRW